MVLTSINPSTGEVLKKFKEWDPTKIEKQVKKSLTAFDIWKNMEISERVKILKNVLRILRKNKKKYARLITTEMGKPILQSESEIEKCIWVCGYYAENGKKFLEDEHEQDIVLSYITACWSLDKNDQLKFECAECGCENVMLK